MLSLSVLILTYNEEVNIEKCIASALPLTSNVYVVDSGSTDRTVELAQSLGATVAENPYKNYANQLNWGLDHFDFNTDWIMRLDADEELTDGLVGALQDFLASPGDVTGVFVRRCINFLGRDIRHGGFYPSWELRVFRRGLGRSEDRFMDAHIVLREGKTTKLHHDLIDRNNKGLSFWIDKHNQYADLEVADVLQGVGKGGGDATALKPSLWGSQAESKRWAKNNIYLRLPLFFRPFLYFLYRYFVRFGFLDGRAGLAFHFLQAFWYRFLVDAKIYEKRARKRAGEG